MTSTKDRWAQIAWAVKSQPTRQLKDIAKDFGVSRDTLYRACKENGVPTNNRPSRKWPGAMVTGTWLHVGDILMEVKSTNRQVEIIGVEYHEDLTVSYRCRPVSTFRKGRTTRIHERTLKNGYVRIRTTERRLPDERLDEWMYGHLN